MIRIIEKLPPTESFLIQLAIESMHRIGPKRAKLFSLRYIPD
jgi:hypothetical protein